MKKVADLVEEARQQITEVSPADALALMQSDGCLVVDIRDIRELDRDGKISGSFHCPRGMLEFWVDPSSPYSKKDLVEAETIVLYCASAWRSALACKALQDMGHRDVRSLAGGFKSWKTEGLPTDSSPSAGSHSRNSG